MSTVKSTSPRPTRRKIVPSRFVHNSGEDVTSNQASLVSSHAANPSAKSRCIRSRNRYHSTFALALSVSRPYFWLVTLWLYLLPTGGRYDLAYQWTFWLGVAYCTMPLNLMCYLMNDIMDVDVDAKSNRKGGGMLGAKANTADLHAIIFPTAALQVAFVVFGFAPRVGTSIVPWFIGVAGANALYNFGPRLSGGPPPFDLLCPCGYMLVIPLSCWLNGLPYPPARSWAHAAFLVIRSQLWIQTFDIGADTQGGRRTTAVTLGLRASQALLGAILLSETVFVFATFTDWALRSFSFSSVGLLCAQVAFAPSTAELSPQSIQCTFSVLGLGGLGLMGQVWCNEAFVSPWVQY